MKLQSLRAVVVDDCLEIRAGLRGLLEALDIRIVGEAENGRGAIEQAESLRPEIILLDVSMPVMGGFEAARALRRSMPDLRIIFVSQHSDRAYVEEAMELGASAYVLKRAASLEVSAAVEAALSGSTFVSPAVRPPRFQFGRNLAPLRPGY